MMPSRLNVGYHALIRRRLVNRTIHYLYINIHSASFIVCSIKVLRSQINATAVSQSCGPVVGVSSKIDKP